MPQNPEIEMKQLGRLESVDLRQVWRREAEDFTSWMAEPTHLALLGETLGLSLELEAQEQEVGRISVSCSRTPPGFRLPRSSGSRRASRTSIERRLIG